MWDQAWAAMEFSKLALLVTVESASQTSFVPKREWTPRASGNLQMTSGWWYTYPFEKYMKVNWDDYSQYLGK